MSDNTNQMERECATLFASLISPTPKKVRTHLTANRCPLCGAIVTWTAKGG